MDFDPCNCFMKIWKSIGTLIPKVGAHLGMGCDNEGTSKTTMKKEKALAKLLARPPFKKLQQYCTLVKIRRPHKCLILKGINMNLTSGNKTMLHYCDKTTTPMVPHGCP